MKFRREIIDSGIKAYRQMEENDRQGRIPLHRTREWKRNERERMKRVKKEEWFKKGGYESLIFVPATPKAELKKKLQRKVDETDIKIKVIEKTFLIIFFLRSTLLLHLQTQTQKYYKRQCYIHLKIILFIKFQIF